MSEKGRGILVALDPFSIPRLFVQFCALPSARPSLPMPCADSCLAEIFSSDFTTPLPDTVDESIMKCPIDTRRSLYKNIVLSGGSTMFKVSAVLCSSVLCVFVCARLWLWPWVVSCVFVGVL